MSTIIATAPTAPLPAGTLPEEAPDGTALGTHGTAKIIKPADDSGSSIEITDSDGEKSSA